MNYTTKAQAKKLTGLNYLGSVNMTTKHQKAFDYNEMTYSLYLAPAKMSGYEVCPKRNKECTALCLNESGMNTMNMEGDKINKSRIKKTQLFFEEREFFMSWMFDEIMTADLKARKLGYKFSVRLNNTSDISPEMFYKTVNGKKVNILQFFQHIQFYDYTKVLNRIELTKKYKNYDLTFSYSGYNIDECMTALDKKIRVAVVFKQVPTKFWGLKVIDGDKYDMRYHDKKNVIVGLKFKRVRNKLDSKIKFVVQ
jgi:hypothetical protein